jgi:hypothetical protein
MHECRDVLLVWQQLVHRVVCRADGLKLVLLNGRPWKTQTLLREKHRRGELVRGNERKTEADSFSFK